jgi:aminoglycoside phosphotransferase (APT) family kinase protein
MRGLRVEDAIVLHNSNRIAVRLVPCDVLVRVAPELHRQGAAFEVEIARRLADTTAPVALLESRVEPGVYVHDGFIVTFWTYYEPMPTRGIGPDEYAQTLKQMHAGMREIDSPTPRFTDRVAEAVRLLVDPSRTPDLGEADRHLLVSALDTMAKAVVQRSTPEQLLHGEPHPGNLMRTNEGLLFVDLETCCLGPVEFDLAHVPEDVAKEYPGLNQDLLHECRILMRAMVTTWRWDRNDELPDGPRWAKAGLDELRTERDRGEWGAS